MSDLLDALRDAQHLVRRMGPFAKAIWVVDRPDLLRAAMVLRDKYAPPTGTPPMCYMGIPIYEWRNYGATEEEYHRAPWFVRVPGVWLEMSDYQHKRLGETQ